MPGIDLRRVTFTAALTGLLALNVCYAFASRTHTLKSGETLDSVARKYKVAVKDIIAANHISDPEQVPDNFKLVIPSAPKKVVVDKTMHNTASVKKDRVSVRIGPGESHRRMTMFDSGVKLTVTAKRDGWAQVLLPDGTIGWVREDFLGIKKKGTSGSAEREERMARRVAEDDEDKPEKPLRRRKSTSRKESGREERVAQKSRKKHTEVAHNSKKHSEHRGREARVARHSRSEADAPKSSSDVIRTAYAYRGTPYVYGGTSRSGFDCSGFTSYVYRKQGVALPHSASEQYHQGHKVSRNNLKPGDLVFFETVHKGISHVGMYVGDGKFVHASSRRSGGVRVDKLEGYYSNRFRGAVRVKKDKE